eukprot:3176851-Pyramimonas_sp.AAC.1
MPCEPGNADRLSAPGGAVSRGLLSALRDLRHGAPRAQKPKRRPSFDGWSGRPFGPPLPARSS